MGFRSVLSLSLLIVVLTSCQSENARILETVKEGMDATGFQSLLDKDYLIVLPRTGCTGCIGSVEEFLMSDSRNYSSKLNVLLTDVVSLKTARIKLGEELISSEYIFIDKNSDFYKGALMSLYPLIIYLEKDEIELVEEVSPKNSQALDNLFFALSE
ncbi:MAG: hypothetical protein HEP71_19065 [Roseivirga sp.]|nr:hypothetical protein [Roseivirga sp.]